VRGSLLVTGTTSDAGKSVVTTGLCRALSRRGLRVAPYKAQNMSNNSMVTADGAEIGRAQWVQAIAARAEPEAAMNPVLLKPGSDRRSHVVVMGRPAGQLAANEFAGGRTALARAAFAAYDDLCSRYDVVVCEGAGSPAEINLRAHDYVNMGLAQHGRIPTVLVGDIDRGGVFAAMHGTLALLDAADQGLLAGFVVNKFRGELSLLRPGLDTLERLTGRPVLGVLPWMRDLLLDSEDSLALHRSQRPSTTVTDRLRVAVVVLPRISNFTDVDALCLEPGLDVAMVDSPRGLAGADVVVLPGTRATIEDLGWLRDRGLADAVVAHAGRGGAVLGICGGFQMLGRSVRDPEGVEGRPGAHVEGLGLLDADTEFAPDKVLRLPTGTALGVPASGYEVHHGRVTVGNAEPFLGGARSGSVFGTMWHGSLEGDELRRAWLAEVAAGAGIASFVTGSASFAAQREAQVDALADAVEEHLDLDRVLSLVATGTPVLPVVRGGLA
jgi:adenosylcobyric acid synthase